MPPCEVQVLDDGIVSLASVRVVSRQPSIFANISRSSQATMVDYRKLAVGRDIDVRLDALQSRFRGAKKCLSGVFGGIIPS
jgi:hypothetical protein